MGAAVEADPVDVCQHLTTPSQSQERLDFQEICQKDSCRAHTSLQATQRT